MESPTRCLQSMVQRIAALSRSFDSAPEATISAVQDIVSKFDSSVLREFLPVQKHYLCGRFTRAVNNIFEREPHGILYADVYQDEFCHINAFGLLKSGVKIPLHDHPNQNAVMKVFQGAVAIRSFTLVPSEDQGSESDESRSEHELGAVLQVRFEGETVISSKSEQNCAFLGPMKGNIHEVISLEPHTYFCDFFVPNTPLCYYYRQLERDSPAAGQLTLLKRIRCPRDFLCGKLMEQLKKEGWNINETLVADLFPDSKIPKSHPEILKTILDEDLRDFGQATIINLLRKEENVFVGPCVLQLLRYRNVSIPRIKEEMNQNDPSHSVIRLFLTDGHTSISAVLTEPINGINQDTPPGTKIALLGEKIHVESGFLMLAKKDIRILGGRVAELIEKWNVERNSVRSEGFKAKSAAGKGTGAPKWVSFGKGGKKIDNLEAGFKANAVMPKNNKDGEESDEFAKNRELMVKELEQEQKVFAKPNLAPPPVKLAEPREPREPKEPKPRKEHKRRGRKNSEDGPDIDLGEYANHKPSGGVTLFDFIGTQEVGGATEQMSTMKISAEEPRKSFGARGRGGASHQNAPNRFQQDARGAPRTNLFNSKNQPDRQSNAPNSGTSGSTSGAQNAPRVNTKNQQDRDSNNKNANQGEKSNFQKSHAPNYSGAQNPRGNARNPRGNSNFQHHQNSGNRNFQNRPAHQNNYQNQNYHGNYQQNAHGAGAQAHFYPQPVQFVPFTPHAPPPFVPGAPGPQGSFYPHLHYPAAQFPPTQSHQRGGRAPRARGSYRGARGAHRGAPRAPGHEWNLNDKCLAPAADGSLQPAVLTSIFPKRKCQVRFDSGEPGEMIIDFLVVP